MTKEEEIKQLKQRIDFYKRELFYSARQVQKEERRNELLKSWLKIKRNDIATAKSKPNEPVFAKTRKEDGTYWFTAWEPNPNDGVLFSQLWCKDNGKFYLVEEFELSHNELQKKIVGVTGKKKDDVQEAQTRRPMMDANGSIMREYIE